MLVHIIRYSSGSSQNAAFEVALGQLEACCLNFPWLTGLTVTERLVRLVSVRSRYPTDHFGHLLSVSL
jgi:hypothetical protein